MTGESFLSLLQFADGLFPAGAYAHSLGLEYYVQVGRVRDAGSVEGFVRAHLRGTAATTDAVAAVNTLRAARAHDLASCLEFDAILEAMKPAAEMREASRQFGRQMLRVATALLADPVAREFSSLAEENRTACHHAIVYGIVGAAQDWEPGETVRAYLYSTASAISAAALRLIPLGQLQGQTVVRNVLPLINLLADECLEMGISEMQAFAPGLEIASMRHARLEARLFRS